MRWQFFGFTVLLLVLTGQLHAQESADIRLADGFENPVGRDGQRYYMARGYRPNGHLGEDWNDVRGGDTDFGAPVYATAHGVVVFARDYKLGWGNVIILRHAYWEDGKVNFVDSLYGHLSEIRVKEGATVTRGQQIGNIGNNHGMYDAHLHFEMRKNIQIGMHRNSYARDFSNYWSPGDFIARHGSLPGDGRIVSVPIHTFSETVPPLLPGPKVYTPSVSPGRATVFSGGDSGSPIRRSTTPHKTFKVDRFDDIRTGYE